MGETVREGEEEPANGRQDHEEHQGSEIGRPVFSVRKSSRAGWSPAQELFFCAHPSLRGGPRYRVGNAFTPKALRPPAQGCEARATLGTVEKENPTPTWVAPGIVLWRNRVAVRSALV